MRQPVICFEESPVQLIGETRPPIPAKPGQIERYDYEYRRNGTANLFVFIDVNRPWRKVKVTEHRAAIGFVFTRGRKRHSLRAHLCEMRTFTLGVARHLIGTVTKSSPEFAAAVREAASAVGKLSCSLGKTMRTF